MRSGSLAFVCKSQYKSTQKQNFKQHSKAPLPQLEVVPFPRMKCLGRQRVSRRGKQRVHQPEREIMFHWSEKPLFSSSHKLMAFHLHRHIVHFTTSLCSLHNSAVPLLVFCISWKASVSFFSCWYLLYMQEELLILTHLLVHCCCFVNKPTEMFGVILLFSL